MKLRTEMRVGVFTAPIGDFDEMSADAAAAHALLQAMGEWSSSGAPDTACYVGHLERRAAELMRQWGFEQDGVG